jgi:superfamily II DNA or RNA helicase
MHLLANILGDDFNVDLVIVDEAHKIGDNQRGIPFKMQSSVRHAPIPS